MEKIVSEEDSKEPKFKVGEEVIVRVNGERGYIILPFRACLVNFGKAAKVIPEENLVLQEPLMELPTQPRGFYAKGDKVRVIPTEKKIIVGVVVDSKWFYVFHLHKSGELKVALAGMLAKGNLKIIPFIPRVILNPKTLPARQGKIL